MIDIDKNKPSEYLLQERNRQQAAIAELSQYALNQTDIDLLLDRAVSLLAETLSVEYAKILEFNPEEDNFLLKAGVGWQDGLVGRTRIDSGRQSQAGYTLLANGPVIVNDLASETRFSGPQLLVDHQVTSGMSVIIHGKDHPYGVLGAHTRMRRHFSKDDLYFLQAISGILASAVRRGHTEMALHRYAKRLEAQHAIDRAILSSQTIYQTASTVVRHVRELVPCIRTSVLVFNFRSSTFSVLASESDTVQESRVQVAPLDQFPADIQMLKSGKISIQEDIQEEDTQNQVVRGLCAEGVRAYACVPLVANGELVGALTLGFGHPGTIKPDRLEVAREVADILAIAYQQARLVESERRRLIYLDELHTIDLAIIRGGFSESLSVVVERVVSSLRVDAATILLYDASEGTLKYGAGSGFRTNGIRASNLHLGEGVAGKAALHRETLFAHNLDEAGESFVRHPLLVGEDFTAYYAVPLIAKDQLKGVLDIFHRTPLDPDKEWLDFLHALATQAAIAVDNAELFAGMQKANQELAHAYDDTIEGWSRALDLRDKETEGHSQRVMDLTLRLVRQLGVPESQFAHIRRGALLHDIGKVGIPDSILLKPGPLSAEEWEIMKKHPDYAYNLLMPIQYLHPALEIPYCHHEHWDGSGYPRGLKGEGIPLSARIFSVVDVWDALRSDRPYRRSWSRAEALQYIQEKAGSQFDPIVVEAFLEVVKGEYPPGPVALDTA